MRCFKPLTKDLRFKYCLFCGGALGMIGTTLGQKCTVIWCRLHCCTSWPTGCFCFWWTCRSGRFAVGEKKTTTRMMTKELSWCTRRLLMVLNGPLAFVCDFDSFAFVYWFSCFVPVFIFTLSEIVCCWSDSTVLTCSKIQWSQPHLPNRPIFSWCVVTVFNVCT